MTKPKKAAFIVSQDPKQLIADERKERPWMAHRVAILLLSPKADQVALVLPKKAFVYGETHVRVPPQVLLPDHETVNRTALKIASDLLSVTVTIKDMQYLGSARGSVYRGAKYDPYGKWIHWVGVRLCGRNGVLNSNSEKFLLPHWWHTNQLLSMDKVVMSDRKYLMLLQALAAFNTLGADGLLTRRAKAQLAA